MKARTAFLGITKTARVGERALRGDDKGTVLLNDERNVIIYAPHELFYYRDESGHEGQSGSVLRYYITLTLKDVGEETEAVGCVVLKRYSKRDMDRLAFARFMPERFCIAK